MSAGKWSLTMNTPMGMQTLTVDLDGRSLRSKLGDSTLENIVTTGNDVSFASTLKTPMGAVQAQFKGTTNGSKISGLCTTAFGELPFEGQRV
jgi:hypothetical protein